ncbi:MAG: hypothetical protein JW915_01895, partial [Chitinispirillaceae bacterium]|nr:hypothetical protein [Chitinispirillaceae bacterium]
RSKEEGGRRKEEGGRRKEEGVKIGVLKSFFISHFTLHTSHFTLPIKVSPVAGFSSLRFCTLQLVLYCW